jgi:hypothetical protein
LERRLQIGHADHVGSADVHAAEKSHVPHVGESNTGWGPKTLFVCGMLGREDSCGATAPVGGIDMTWTSAEEMAAAFRAAHGIAAGESAF